MTNRQGTLRVGSLTRRGLLAGILVLFGLGFILSCTSWGIRVAWRLWAIGTGLLVADVAWHALNGHRAASVKRGRARVKRGRARPGTLTGDERQPWVREAVGPLGVGIAVLALCGDIANGLQPGALSDLLGACAPYLAAAAAVVTHGLRALLRGRQSERRSGGH